MQVECCVKDMQLDITLFQWAFKNQIEVSAVKQVKGISLEIVLYLLNLNGT